MKLIDILVRELPKRDGWPDGSNACRQFPDGEICFNHVSREPDFYAELSDDVDLVWRATKSPHVTKEQYEDALAASQQASKPEWNGEGLPPVGCECDVKIGGDYFNLCRVVYSDNSCGVAFVYLGGDDEKYCGQIDCVSAKAAADYFRPIRSEADKKRAEVGLALYHVINWNAEGELVSQARMEDYKKAYDAIASGKIPGVKLED